MSSRHTRRKASKAKQFDKLCNLAQAERARQVNQIVRANLSKPKDRSYFAPVSIGAMAHHIK